MKKILFGALISIGVLAVSLPAARPASAASDWAGHRETPYISGNPAYKATLDISQFGSNFFVVLRDNIPQYGWNNPDCHGPGRAYGFGSLLAPDFMRVAFLWVCADGSFRFSVRYLHLGGLNNETIVFCDTSAMSSCGINFHRVT